MFDIQQKLKKVLDLSNATPSCISEEKKDGIDLSQESLYLLYLAAVFESSNDAILGKTLDGIITIWNPAAEKLYGYTAQEMIGKSVATLVPSELQDDLASILSQLKEGHKIERHETTRVCKDGTRVRVSVTISPIKDLLGNIIGASTIAHEITAQKKAEERALFLSHVSKVLTSSLDYQTILSRIAQIVVPQLADWFAVDLVNAEGNFELIKVGHKDPAKVHWAKELRQHYHIDPNAPIGAAQVVRTGKAEIYPTITEEMLVASARTEEELALYHQIGIASAMIAPLIARDHPFGVVTFVSTESGRRFDAADLAFAEELGHRTAMALDNATLYRRVQQSRDELYTILQNVADGIMVLDAKETLIYANDIAAHINGFSSVEHLMAVTKTSSLTAILSNIEITDEAGKVFLSHQLPSYRALEGETQQQAFLQYKDFLTGQTRWVLVKAEPILDEYGQVQFAVTVMTDVTERYVVEQRKDDFIRMASHELRTPITVLKGFMYMLQRHLKKKEDKQGLSFYSRMDGQLDKLTRLISDLLDISKMQVGKLDYQKDLFDLTTLTREVTENMQETVKTHRLLFEGQANVIIWGDKERIGQVIINLLTNAIKFSPQANKVMIHLSADQQYALLSIQDFGIGITEADQAHIFERFYQVTGAEERTFSGLGIGLYICHEIVQRHHGRIWVESHKGEGALFHVDLPLYSMK